MKVWLNVKVHTRPVITFISVHSQGMWTHLGQSLYPMVIQDPTQTDYQKGTINYLIDKFFVLCYARFDKWIWYVSHHTYQIISTNDQNRYLSKFVKDVSIFSEDSGSKHIAHIFVHFSSSLDTTNFVNPHGSSQIRTHDLTLRRCIF